MLVTMRIFPQSNASKEPHVCNQQELDNLKKDLSFTKSNAQILTPFLKRRI